MFRYAKMKSINRIFLLNLQVYNTGNTILMLMYIILIYLICIDLHSNKTPLDTKKEANRQKTKSVYFFPINTFKFNF